MEKQWIIHWMIFSKKEPKFTNLNNMLTKEVGQKKYIMYGFNYKKF